VRLCPSCDCPVVVRFIVCCHIDSLNSGANCVVTALGMGCGIYSRGRSERSAVALEAAYGSQTKALEMADEQRARVGDAQ
jgi:hypothetical protein